MSVDQLFAVLRPSLNLLRDILFVVLYVKSIHANQKQTPKRRYLAAVMLLLACVTILVGNSVDNLGTVAVVLPGISAGGITYLRLTIRFICYYSYIRLLKNISRSTALYDTLLITTICTIDHNLFLTPLTRPILNATVGWSEIPLVNYLLCLAVTNAVSILVYYLVYRFIPLSSIKNINHVRIAVLLILMIESHYLNTSLKLISYTDPEQARQFSIYTVMLQLLLLVCLVYIEQYQKTSREHIRIALENQAAHSLLEHIEKQKSNDELIRCIRHDLKNHLHSLRYLIEHDRNEDAVKYLDSLVSDYLAFQPRIQTGNLILDGILAQKMEKAEQNSVAFSVTSDFSYLEPVCSADLCILFGNLLDNALEACQRVDKPFRYITIRGRLLGESILYTIENSCLENLSFEGSIPLTTKANKNIHGIGLQSVTRIVKKYQGTIAFSCQDGRFSAIVSFPLPLASITDS